MHCIVCSKTACGDTSLVVKVRKQNYENKGSRSITVSKISLSHKAKPFYGTGRRRKESEVRTQVKFESGMTIESNTRTHARTARACKRKAEMSEFFFAIFVNFGRLNLISDRHINF